MELILIPNNDSDYQLFIQLAKRLNVKFRVVDSKEAQEESRFFSLAGSLDTPECGEEFLALLKN